MNYYYQKLLELNADGIDFINSIDFVDFIDIHNDLIKHDTECKYVILHTVTKYDFENNNDNATYIPKTNYVFWRMINGEKVYIDDE